MSSSEDSGCRHKSAVPLPVTGRERGAVLLLSALILGGGLAPQYLLDDRRQAADDVYPPAMRKKTPPAARLIVTTGSRHTCRMRRASVTPNDPAQRPVARRNWGSR